MRQFRGGRRRGRRPVWSCGNGGFGFGGRGGRERRNRRPAVVTGFGKGTRVPLNRERGLARSLIGSAGAREETEGTARTGWPAVGFRCLGRASQIGRVLRLEEKRGTDAAPEPGSSQRRTGAGSYRDFGRTPTEIPVGAGRCAGSGLRPFLAHGNERTSCRGGRSGGRCRGDRLRSRETVSRGCRQGPPGWRQ